MGWFDSVTMDVFLGETITGIRPYENELVFTTASGKRYRMYHEQDCCERVVLEDVVGEWDDIIGSPITMAEEVTQTDRDDGAKPRPDPDFPDWADESFTWTFYKFGTAKGYVTLRWYGTSNGYYSEDVMIVPLVED